MNKTPENSTSDNEENPQSFVQHRATENNGIMDMLLLGAGKDANTTRIVKEIGEVVPSENVNEFKSVFLRLASSVQLGEFNDSKKINEALFQKMEQFIAFWKLEQSSHEEYHDVILLIETEYTSAKDKYAQVYTYADSQKEKLILSATAALLYGIYLYFFS